MDDIIVAVVELAGTLLEETLKSIKDPGKRKWALTIFYAMLAIAVVGAFVLGAVSLQAEGNRMGAVVFAVIALFLFTLFGFFIIRRHK